MRKHFVAAFVILAFLFACTNSSTKKKQIKYEQEQAVQAFNQQLFSSWEYLQKSRERYSIKKADIEREANFAAKEIATAVHDSQSLCMQFEKLYLYNGLAPDIHYVRRSCFAYNAEQGTYYAFLPFCWATYTLYTDSIFVSNLQEKQCSVSYRRKIVLPRHEDCLALFEEGKSKEYVDSFLLNKQRISYEPRDSSYNKYSITSYIEFSNEERFFAYSLGKHPQIRRIDSMLFGLDLSINRLDTLLRFLHNAATFPPMDFMRGQRHYIERISLKEGAQGISYISDTAVILKYEAGVILMDAFERLCLPDLQNLELLYPDFSSEKVPEIAEYAQQKKPTFIYFKRAQIRNDNTAYYFLFYYLDYIPFYGWHLRDMEVVFPRRFLADLALKR